jgi:hypothetical protein
MADQSCLGQMSQAKQATLTSDLTALLRAVLLAWHGPAPRLTCITDKGSVPDEYYRRVLLRLKHPREGRVLPWEWVLDFYHVCGYVGKVADALFGAETPGRRSGSRRCGAGCGSGLRA